MRKNKSVFSFCCGDSPLGVGAGGGAQYALELEHQLRWCKVHRP